MALEIATEISGHSSRMMSAVRSSCAGTGQHPLIRELPQIDREYKALYDACLQQGVELVNLGEESRLTTLPRSSPQEFARTALAPEDSPSLSGRRVFFVNYKFLSCGDVFREGLSNAARDLNLCHEEAYWDDPGLDEKVRRFSPDLLFVVHGRRFSQRWKNTFKGVRSAVWLLDEPYEVDDTARFSGLFDTVLTNDPATLHRHRNAHYLPVCYDPARYFYHPGSARQYDIGFVGGYNPWREQALAALAQRGMLSYVAGGSWRTPAVRALSLASNIPAEKTAELYRNTRIILNVFRTEHHFNRQSIPAVSLNPRVYEGAACGALVISENRPEVSRICPDLPVFSSAEELCLTLEEMLRNPALFELARKACIRQLSRHTYAHRLYTTMNLIFEKETSVMQTPAPASPRAANAPADDSHPTYSILMVAHNVPAMTRLSTLQTLRHSRDARLIVVDNASSDGTEEWLKLLAQRGDIHLITSKTNLGHGPALELARRAVRSPYIVTLDNDAFPVSDEWLQRLRERITGPVKLAGIRHYRDYIHPSCLMVERQTLDDLGLTFLDEKGRPSQFDVAERISHEVKRRGFQLSGLEQTSSLRRGSVSEPIDLGVEYSGLVHHQWYTTRAAMAAGARVDDVPNDAIERSLQEVFDKYHAEPRELAVIVGVRAGVGETDRLRNAKACLQALNLQDLERWRYRIIIVEQDSEPRLESALAPLADRYVFAYNPGPYNRGWGFNVGACLPAAAKILCLIDADLLVSPSFLSNGLKQFMAGSRALRPYNEIVYLDRPSTGQAIQRRMDAPMSSDSAEYNSGQVFHDSNGGCIWVEARLYEEIGGHDERFRGWGWEDRDFWRRLARLTAIETMQGRMHHLDHTRLQMNDRWATANSELDRQLVERKASAWRGPMGSLRRYAGENPNPDVPVVSATSRDWENWHRWEQSRIDRIVADEAHKSIHSSARWRLAQLLPCLGRTLLDVGCGPGALWGRLEPLRERISWTGLDTTQQMLDVAHRNFPDVPLFLGDSGSLPFEPGSFDVVLLRHVLEHQPPWLMEKSLAQAMRVAKRAVVVDFYLAPSAQGPRSTQRVGENFLETRWTEDDIKTAIAANGWQLLARMNLTATNEHCDEVWILVPPAASQQPPAPAPDQAAGLKISIVMPTYRRSHTLLRTLQTIWAQTYQNWELILIDNAGDGGYFFPDPRIKVFRHCERASASYARNHGLQHATGDLVCFFDDDDDMFPAYLERFASVFQTNPRARMVRCGMQVPGGRIDYSHATPEVCLRREAATPTWNNRNFSHDQHYFSAIVAANRWSEEKSEIVIIREPLCRSYGDPCGGLRGGAL